jgi:DNA-binding response OmpR family regulator
MTQVAQSIASAGGAANVTVGRLALDRARYTATFDGHDLGLSAREIELLFALVARSDRVTSRSDLAEAVGRKDGRSVDVLLSALRRKLPESAIRNVRSRGWILDPRAFGAA